jgi:hypothetical protein
MKFIRAKPARTKRVECAIVQTRGTDLRCIETSVRQHAFGPDEIRKKRVNMIILITATAAATATEAPAAAAAAAVTATAASAGATPHPTPKFLKIIMFKFGLGIIGAYIFAPLGE